MRKLYHVYRDTATTMSARNHLADFSNVGVVTHLILSWSGTYSSGTGTAGVLASTLIDVNLEGFGKVIDNLTLQQCAGVADLEGGAVIYQESAAAANSTGLPVLHCAIPIGMIDLRDDVLKVRIAQAANAAVVSAQTMSVALACLRDGHEIGIYQYERTSLAFTAASQRLQKDYRAYGYDRVYMADFAGICSQFEVKPDNAPESYGYIEALQAFNYTCTNQEAFAALPTAWNKVYLLSDERMFADSTPFSVAAIATGAGTIELVTRRRLYRPSKVVQSKNNFAIKQAQSRMIEVQQNPQAVQAKGIVKSITTKAGVYGKRY